MRFMKVKGILADKKKKNMIMIIGTILIILITACVFSYEAATIPVKTLSPVGQEIAQDTPAEAADAANQEGHVREERTGTIEGSGPGGIFSENRRNQDFQYIMVDEGAKRLIVTVSSDKDIDLYLFDPNGDAAGSSATPETTEIIEIKNPMPGEWEACVLHWSVIPRPMNSATYHMIIDIYYV